MDLLNYKYDNIGNLESDKSEDIESIGWNLYGKLLSLSRRAGSGKTNLGFLYDPLGNRIVKMAYNCDVPTDENKQYSIYARDAQGNIMGTYTLKYYIDSGKYILIADGNPIYGSSKIGVLNSHINFSSCTYATNISTTTTFTAGQEVEYNPVLSIEGWGQVVNPFNPPRVQFSRTLGNKAYELTDHLGNVAVTIPTER